MLNGTLCCHLSTKKKYIIGCKYNSLNLNIISHWIEWKDLHSAQSASEESASQFAFTSAVAINMEYYNRFFRFVIGVDECEWKNEFCKATINMELFYRI